jgi:hypothetical protein
MAAGKRGNKVDKDAEMGESEADEDELDTGLSPKNRCVRRRSSAQILLVGGVSRFRARKFSVTG